MKIKIEFTEPPYAEMSIPRPLGRDERLVFIRDPYTITMLPEGRNIVDDEGAEITYEEYCVKLQQIIAETIRVENLSEAGDCDSITIAGCKEPPNFAALNSTLANANLPISPKCNLIFKDCSFSGALYVNAVINFMKSVRKRNPDTSFNITVDERAASKLSDHDKAKLGGIKQCGFFS